MIKTIILIFSLLIAKTSTNMVKQAVDMMVKRSMQNFRHPLPVMLNSIYKAKDKNGDKELDAYTRQFNSDFFERQREYMLQKALQKSQDDKITKKEYFKTAHEVVDHKPIKNLPAIIRKEPKDLAVLYNVGPKADYIQAMRDSKLMFNAKAKEIATFYSFYSRVLAQSQKGKTSRLPAEHVFEAAEERTDPAELNEFMNEMSRTFGYDVTVNSINSVIETYKINNKRTLVKKRDQIKDVVVELVERNMPFKDYAKYKELENKNSYRLSPKEFKKKFITFKKIEAPNRYKLNKEKELMNKDKPFENYRQFQKINIDSQERTRLENLEKNDRSTLFKASTTSNQQPKNKVDTKPILKTDDKLDHGSVSKKYENLQKLSSKPLFNKHANNNNYGQNEMQKRRANDIKFSKWDQYDVFNKEKTMIPDFVDFMHGQISDAKNKNIQSVYAQTDQVPSVYPNKKLDKLINYEEVIKDMKEKDKARGIEAKSYDVNGMLEKIGVTDVAKIPNKQSSVVPFEKRETSIVVDQPISSSIIPYKKGDSSLMVSQPVNTSLASVKKDDTSIMVKQPVDSNITPFLKGDTSVMVNQPYDSSIIPFKKGDSSLIASHDKNTSIVSANKDLGSNLPTIYNKKVTDLSTTQLGDSLLNANDSTMLNSSLNGTNLVEPEEVGGGRRFNDRSIKSGGQATNTLLQRLIRTGAFNTSSTVLLMNELEKNHDKKAAKINEKDDFKFDESQFNTFTPHYVPLSFDVENSQDKKYKDVYHNQYYPYIMRLVKENKRFYEIIDRVLSEQQKNTILGVSKEVKNNINVGKNVREILPAEFTEYYLQPDPQSVILMFKDSNLFSDINIAKIFADNIFLKQNFFIDPASQYGYLLKPYVDNAAMDPHYYMETDLKRLSKSFIGSFFTPSTSENMLKSYNKNYGHVPKEIVDKSTGEKTIVFMRPLNFDSLSCTLGEQRADKIQSMNLFDRLEANAVMEFTALEKYQEDQPKLKEERRRENHENNQNFERDDIKQMMRAIGPYIDDEEEEETQHHRALFDEEDAEEFVFEVARKYLDIKMHQKTKNQQNINNYMITNGILTPMVSLPDPTDELTEHMKNNVLLDLPFYNFVLDIEAFCITNFDIESCQKLCDVVTKYYTKQNVIKRRDHVNLRKGLFKAIQSDDKTAFLAKELDKDTEFSKLFAQFSLHYGRMEYLSYHFERTRD